MTDKNPLASNKLFHLKLLQFSFEGSPLILKDLVQVELPRHTEQPWEDGELWKKWCVENIEHIKKFRFANKMSTIKFEGEDVPDLDQADVTFLYHVLQKFVKNLELLKKLKDKRNEYAHTNVKEMNVLNFVVAFGEIVVICRELFQDYPDIRQKWEEYLTKLLLEEIHNQDRMEQIYALLLEMYNTDFENFMKREKAPQLRKGLSHQNLKTLYPLNQVPSRKSKEFKDSAEMSKDFKEDVKQMCKIFYVPGSRQQLDVSKDYIDVGFKKITNEMEKQNLCLDEDSDDDDEVLGKTTWKPRLESTTTIDCFFQGLVSEIENQKSLKLLICANGGFGKTTVAKNITYKWANDECLTSFFMVFHLMIKHLDFSKDLFENIIIQHHHLENYSNLHETLINKSSNLLWILDGLDDCSSKPIARNFLRKNISGSSVFGSSSFLFLTRPKSRDLLKGIVADVTEFTIAPLSKDHSLEFVNRFQFCDDQDKKREAIRQKYKSSSSMINLMTFPMFLVMICAIFDDRTISDELGGFLHILAMTIKQEIGRLGEDMDKLYRRGTMVLLTENIRILAALGKVFLRSDFYISEDRFYEKLEKSLTQDQASIACRLAILHQVVVDQGTKSWSSFYVIDKKLEELIIGIFLITNSSPIGKEVVRSNIGQKHINVLRCASTLLLKDMFKKKHSSTAFVEYVKYIFDSSKSFTRWRCWQIIVQMIKIVIKKSSCILMASEVIRYVQTRGESFFSPEEVTILQNKINQEFYEHLRSHLVATFCTLCALPRKLVKKLAQFAFVAEYTFSEQSWPHEELFYIHKIFFISDDFFFLCLHEKDSFTVQEHATGNSTFILRMPMICLKGSTFHARTIRLPDPIPVELVEAPPIFRSHHATANRFPIGVGIIAVSFKGKIYIWGGYQEQPNGALFFLPVDLFVMDPKDNSWQRIKASGDVPPPTTSAIGVATKESIYLFGGLAEGKASNKLYTLDLTGRFEKINPVGQLPAPRSHLCGWEYEGALYYFGGCGPKLGLTFAGFLQGGDWSQWEGQPGRFANNQLLRYDPGPNNFSLPETSGTPPSPRANFGVARLRTKVFLHGGICGEEIAEGFFSLEMKTAAWSRLTDTGIGRSICTQTMTPITGSKFLVVGGSKLGQISKKVGIYDARNSTWKDEPDLPAELCVDGGGLMLHAAVAVKKRNRVIGAFCFGGYVDKETTTHPCHVIKFDLKA